eukprot:2398472-Pleurochrysis_carterae.AAC.2
MLSTTCANSPASSDQNYAAPTARTSALQVSVCKGELFKSFTVIARIASGRLCRIASASLSAGAETRANVQAETHANRGRARGCARMLCAIACARAWKLSLA